MGCNQCKCLNNELDNIEYKDTKVFVPPVTCGKVIKVYDGDTITIANKLPFKNDNTIYRFNVRLARIDAPEIKGKTDDEKQAAIISRDALSNKILNKYVMLKEVETEKYGRLLATIFFEGTDINDWMAKKRYAVLYNGKTKIKPDNWLTYQQYG